MYVSLSHPFSILTSSLHNSTNYKPILHTHASMVGTNPFSHPYAQWYKPQTHSHIPMHNDTNHKPILISLCTMVQTINPFSPPYTQSYNPQTHSHLPMHAQWYKPQTHSHLPVHNGTNHKSILTSPCTMVQSTNPFSPPPYTILVSLTVRDKTQRAS